MLDFGALSCTKRAPQCASCDARPVCAWKGEGPDPAIGSAGVGRGQSRFEGSDRQGRGRLVDAMRVAPVAIAELAAVMGWGDDHERARRVADTLLPDGLAVLANGAFELP
jgi:A/G-specific adenine glycosylase